MATLHDMIDLETMGTDHYSPILSIGACIIDLDDPSTIDIFYQPITLESCMELGMKPSASTIEWWMKQGDEAKKVFIDPAAVKLPMALDAFTDWLNSRPMKHWGNSAAFDIGLIRDAYKVCGKECPIGYRDEMCYRTLKNMPFAASIEFNNVGTAHNALDDAIAQADHLRRIIAAMKL